MAKKRLWLEMPGMVLVLSLVLLAVSCATDLKNQELGQLNVTGKADGVYRGTYKTWPLAAEVDVTIKAGTIVGIDLVKHKYGRGKPAEEILERVIEKQSLNVDTISGATASSKTILIAIRNSLEN
jgi:uncharacterized protein with FMN-binding domain